MTPPADSTDYVKSPFVLDLASNPHPDLLALAIGARRYWLGIRDGMAAATGASTDDIEAWVVAHDLPLTRIDSAGA